MPRSEESDTCLSLIASCTLNHDPFSVKFSPFTEKCVAVAGAKNFGVHGAGHVTVLQLQKNNEFEATAKFDFDGGILDVCWSELDPKRLLCAGADGTVSLCRLGKMNNTPVARFQEHDEAASCVAFNFIEKNSFISASFDGNLKLWDPKGSESSLSTFYGAWPVNDASWSPHEPAEFLSCDARGRLRIWDTRWRPTGASALEMGNDDDEDDGGEACVLSIGAHDAEVLSCSWDPAMEHGIFSASVDGAVRYWDRRFVSSELAPVVELRGDGFTVRSMTSHPRLDGIVGAAAEDGQIIIWDDELHNTGDRSNDGSNATGRVIATAAHSECATSIGFSVLCPERVITCGWDDRVCCWELSSGLIETED